MPSIISIGRALPSYAHQQSSILEFMQENLPLSEKAKRQLSIIYQRSGILQRFSVINDFSEKNTDASFFGKDKKRTVAERLKIYKNEAVLLAEKAILNTISEEKLPEITHLITVSCTGLSAPGLDIELIKKMPFRKNIIRFSVNFMGCYAAIHALRLADTICKADANARVIVVCCELCTLHFQDSEEADHLLSGSLFADGAAACLVSNETSGLQLLDFNATLTEEGLEDMSWDITSDGFLMKLSGQVPRIIKKSMGDFMQNIFQKNKITKTDVRHWAVHPGGKNILEAVQSSLDVDKKEMMSSYKILEKYGNMSSVTLLFVLDEISQYALPNEPTIAIAFGPGLSVETILLNYQK